MNSPFENRGFLARLPSRIARHAVAAHAAIAEAQIREALTPELRRSFAAPADHPAILIVEAASPQLDNAASGSAVHAPNFFIESAGATDYVRDYRETWDLEPEVRS
jgi:nucleoid-associated protein YgaU